jgi:hypothetical protein
MDWIPAFAGMTKIADGKLQHWRGFQRHFSLKAAPMLEFNENAL